MEKNCNDNCGHQNEEICNTCPDHVPEVGEMVSTQGEKREMFEKVYVDGKEENLPKKDGDYFVSPRFDGLMVYYFGPQGRLRYEWMEDVEWWLRPVE